MRRVLPLLPVALLLLAAAEIAVFAAVAHAIGAGWAVLLIAASSVAGLALLRREGIRGWRAFRAAAEAGRPPGAQVSNSLIGLLGALLLAMPGFITAVTGLALIIPPGRYLARRGVERAAERRLSAAVAGDLFGPRHVRVHQSDPVDDPAPAPRAPAGEIISGEVVEGDIVR
ncbi:FxsA family protein [Actinoplanes sp. NPDC049316]|uniref:FxsA family protein n=1 Tax=Actinoplanes sp. NPDC049316 TaxID=3154727 RepID=UPI0034120218